MLTAQRNISGNGSNLLAFIGGFIGAMTHYVNNIKILLSLNGDELLDFSIHSLIGGAVMLTVKVLGDWILHKIKTPKQNEKKENE